MIELFFIFLQILFVIYLLYFIFAFLSGAPFVPSTKKTSDMMIKESGIRKGMCIVDLGSGDGRLLIRAAKHGAQAIGYEINPFLVAFTNIRLLFTPYRKQVKVYWKNFWNADISRADIVFVYLVPWHMEKLEQKLQLELKPGTIIVSNSFIFPHWKTIRANPKYHVYVFRVH